MTKEEQTALTKEEQAGMQTSVVPIRNSASGETKWITISLRQQFVAIMKKNFIIKSRKWKGTSCEIILPALLMLFMVWIRTLVDVTDVPDMLFPDESYRNNVTSPPGPVINSPGLIPLGLMPLFGRASMTQGSLSIVPNTDPQAVSFYNLYKPLLTFAGFGAQLTNNFSTEQELEDYCAQPSYGIDLVNYPPITAAIIFHDSGPTYWNYSIRLNATGRDATGVDTFDAPTDDFQNSYSGWWFLHFLYFVPLQNVVNKFILQQSGISATNLVAQPFPVSAHTDDGFASFVSDILGFFVTCILMLPAVRTTKEIVEEKELRIKEGMKMMGLGESMIWGAHLASASIQFTFSALLIVLFTMGTVYKFSNLFLVWLLFYMIFLSVFSFSYLVSAFFSRARVASTMGAVLWLGLFFGYWALGRGTPRGDLLLASLAAPIAYSLGFARIAKMESVSVGMQFTNFDAQIDGYSTGDMFGFLMLDIVLYMVLGLYLSKVLPSTYGVQHKFWFLCDPSYWRKQKQEMRREDLTNYTAAPRPETEFEPVADSISRDIGVEIKKLHKEFDSGGDKLVAVDNMDLEMYRGQIFCLLGHNGAGKTTTINMLSGLMAPTGGDATVEGISIREDLEKIRSILGVCPQHDILFPLLSVKEHLFMFANIKGMVKSEIPDAVAQIIVEVGLTEKINFLSQQLSGGQKRKLSVAIALIGSSKIIFLDEPTSGMDPYARRSTWDLLKKKKEGRVIVLTTHFMDEADYLGDRIAIMAHGKIKCCGSSLFLKSRYGVGYTMTVTKTDQTADSTDMTNLVMTHVPKASILNDSAGEIAYRLPNESVKQFSDLFDETDMHSAKLAVQSYAISITTMEEVFLRVAANETDEEQGQLAKTLSKKLSKRQSNSAEKHHDESAAIIPKFMFFTHFVALVKKRFHYTKRDKKIWWYQLVYPLIALLLGAWLIWWASNFVFSLRPLDGPFLYNTPLRIPHGGDSVLTFTNPNAGEEFVSAAGASTSRSMAQYLLANRNANKESVYGAFIFNQTADSRFSNKFPLPPGDLSANDTFDTILFNTTATDSLPVFLNTYYTQRGRQLSGNVDFNIAVNNNPLPITATRRTLETGSITFIIGIAFAFIPASFISMAVYERRVKCKHLQIISGVSHQAYWFSFLMWDFATFLVPGLLSIVVYAIFNLEQLLDENVAAYIVLVIANGLSVTPFAYCASFLFDSEATAQSMMLLFGILTGMILLIVSRIMDFIESTRELNQTLKMIYRVFPAFAFSRGTLDLIERKITFYKDEQLEPFDWDATGVAITYMFCECVIYFGIVLFIEVVLGSPILLERTLFIKKRMNQWIRLDFSGHDPDLDIIQVPEDPDVYAEKERVKSGKADEDMIVLHGLRKVYPSKHGSAAKVAVQDLWFGIPRGQVFGFLGINGAGKTSTIKMLTADVLPTLGDANLNGLSILTNQGKVRHLIGYCPQFDALIHNMTAREHLTLFARIKGTPEEKISGYVSEMITKIGLTEYADKTCGGYSGGNRRKLSVGIALIGDPKIVFLDEPSTGMDPQSRRFMWNLISSTMANRSVVLTTHSMEECQALCQRIGIMVGGRLMCLGSIPHLQATHGRGFQLDVNTDQSTVGLMRQFIEQTFYGADLLEAHGTRLKYRLQKDNMTRGGLFRIIEDNRDRLKVIDYSVSDMTLEQIFIHFAKQQSEETGAVAGLEGGYVQLAPTQGAQAPTPVAQAPAYTSDPVVAPVVEESPNYEAKPEEFAV